MNALEAVNKAIHYCFEMNKAVYGVTMHEEWTTRGYVFVVEAYGKCYIVCNKRDFIAACAIMRMTEPSLDLCDYIYGIAIDESEQFFQTAISGTYLWTQELESNSPPPKNRLSFPNT